MPHNDLPRVALAFVIGAMMSLGPATGATQAGAPSVQYRSPEGVEYRSLPDTDTVRSARTALAAEPKNIARIIDLGVAESGARQFREAIATFTRGLDIEPNNALLLRWRGHRYLSVREFDHAFADLTRGASLDPTIYGLWYHLGVVQYVRGDFSSAAASFAKAQPIAPDAGELAGSTDWLWMSLSRAGRGAEAKAMLDRRADNKPVDNAYTRRLRLYRGEIGPEAVVTAADTDDVQVATLAYGLGNWYLIRGDKAQARKWFERSIQSGGWPAFGFIASEAELRRFLPQAPTASRAQSRTLVALLAHADDESAASPVLARYAREGVHVHLIIATDGSGGSGSQTYLQRSDSGPVGDALVKARTEEARCAAAALGVQEPVLFGFPDGKLGDYLADRGLLGRLTERIAQEIERLHPDAVITWGPDGGTGHPDHRLVGDIATQLQRAGAPGMPDRLYYMYLPVEGFRALNPQRGEPPMLIPQAKYFTVHVPFEPADLEAAQKSMACHGSQFTPETLQGLLPVMRQAWNGQVAFIPTSAAASGTDLFR